MQVHALFDLPFSDLRSDQYSLSHSEINAKIPPKWPVFHSNSTNFDPIANWRMVDKRGHQTECFMYRLCSNTIRTLIHDCSEKCWHLRSEFCMEPNCNDPGSVPTPNQNRTQNLKPLLTLAAGVPSSAIRSILESTLGSLVENVLRGVPGSVLEVYFEASWELTWEDRVEQGQNVLLSAIGSIFEIMVRSVLKSILRANLGACNNPYLAVLLNAAWCIALNTQYCMNIRVI